MKRLLFLFVLLLLQACYHDRSPEVEIPKEDPPVSPEMMSDILVDMHLAQSTIKEMQAQGKNIDGISEEYHALILKKYGVSREDFDKSLEYYNYRTDDLKAIYEEVITKLSLMESELKSVQQDTVP